MQNVHWTTYKLKVPELGEEKFAKNGFWSLLVILA